MGRFKRSVTENGSMTSVNNQSRNPTNIKQADTSYPSEASTNRGHKRLAALLSNGDPAEAVAPAQVESNLNKAASYDNSAETAFPQSVASGDPTPTGVVLWTRIDPQVYEPTVPIVVEVAHDEAFDNPVYQGTVDSGRVGHDHTVKIDLDGCLTPDERYYYRFIHDNHYSRAGQCRTLPDPNSSPERIRFAILTCQDYQNGYFSAYSHIADEDVDFLVHVGDFIYESAAGHYKGLGSLEYPDRELHLPSGHDRAWGLTDYRYLYRTYRSDEFLQAALEEHTLIPARDDHEFTNNIYWDDEVKAPQGPSHPRGDDPEYMLQLTADALLAWWEYMPTRIEYDPDAEALHERFRLWQHYQFGDLLTLVMTDERLYRNSPRGNGLVPAWGSINPDREEPGRTMLGKIQRQWLLNRLREDTTTWMVWSDEVLTMPFRIGIPPATIYPMQSGWDGYTRERQEILAALSKVGVSNFVTLTGDMHCCIGGYQLANPYEWMRHLDNDGTNKPEINERIGVELMTPAVTSVNIAEAVGVSRGIASNITERLLRWAVRIQNPHLRFFDSHHNGYSVVEFTPAECVYVGYSVDKTVNTSDTEREVIKRLRVPEGRVAIEELSRKRLGTNDNHFQKQKRALRARLLDNQPNKPTTKVRNRLQQSFVRGYQTIVRLLREIGVR